MTAGRWGAARDGRDTAVAGRAVVPAAPAGARSTAPATPQQARDAVGCARAAGFEDVSHRPDVRRSRARRPADLEADLAEALALGPDHVSWYELELKPGSALARRGLPAGSTRTRAPTPTAASSQGLEDAGYRWYETANFARPGHECRHSLAYWGAADYLGHRGRRRQHGRRPPLAQRAGPGAGYVAALADGRGAAAHASSRSTSTTCAASAGCWACGWRRALTLAWAGPPDHPEALDAARAAGLLRAGEDAVALTREGRFVQNAILHELMEYA